MKVTLIHNAAAGGARRAPPEAIVEALGAAGFEARFAPTGEEAALGPALTNPGELVVVAGGDGTVRATAERLLGRPGGPVPLAIVPLGTSNNLGRALGLTGRDPLELARGLAAPRRAPLDVGLARGPWGERCFLESFGVGLLAGLLHRYDPEAPKGVLRGAAALVASLVNPPALTCRVSLDGERLDGEYLLVEALNTPTVSNGLRLAPGADPTDGWLELVLVPAGGAMALAREAAALALDRFAALDGVVVRPGRRVLLEWTGSPAHADAEVWPVPGEAPPAGPLAAALEVRPGALEVWVPG